MARIPTITRLSSEDFKDQASWISPLLTILNIFMSGIISILNKGITFADNVNCQMKDIEFVQDSTNGYPITFTCTLKTKPVGLWVVNALDLAASPSILSSAIFVDWTFGNGVVAINNISGLTDGKKYRISVIIIAE